MDVCLENTSKSGSPPDTVTTRQLAEKVTEIYWPHALPFPFGGTTSVLRQANRGQAEILSYIEDFRSRLGDGSVPWSRYPENGLLNLVVADVKCNGNKRDFLAQ